MIGTIGNPSEAPTVCDPSETPVVNDAIGNSCRWWFIGDSSLDATIGKPLVIFVGHVIAHDFFTTDSTFINGLRTDISVGESYCLVVFTYNILQFSIDGNTL